MAALPRPGATRERGAALVVTLMLVSALVAAGGLAMYLTLADTRGTQVVVEERSSLDCAEAGLAGARDYVASHVSSWQAMLDGDPSNDPPGYPVTGDLDGDGVDDWQVTLRDNDDEFPTNDPTRDSDGVVFMVSTCVEFADTPRSITELVSVGGGGTNYRTQAGGGGGNTGNSNSNP